MIQITNRWFRGPLLWAARRLDQTGGTSASLISEKKRLQYVVSTALRPPSGGWHQCGYRPELISLPRVPKGDERQPSGGGISNALPVSR